jgi:hypothetical protein
VRQGWRWLFALVAVLPTLAGTLPARAQVPDLTRSYFVPQSGSLAAPAEGAPAIANARRCPNIDGTGVLRFAARLKVVVRADDGTLLGSPIAGIPASDICVLFNGGTTVQGFSGMGDDTIIANSMFNPAAGCPDVRCVQADAATDLNGETYITWIGHAASDPPGVVTNQALSRDPLTRKWGGYAGDIPVRVMFAGLPYFLLGRLTSMSPNGTYTAHVKDLDSYPRVGGAVLNQGELVSSLDIAPVQAALTSPYVYHLDFDNNGVVNSLDMALIRAHNTHRCNSPMSP